MDNPWAVHDDQPPPSPLQTSPKLDDQLPKWTTPSWTAPAADAWGQTPAWGEETDITAQSISPEPELEPEPKPEQEQEPELEAAALPAPSAPVLEETEIPDEDDHQEIPVPVPTSPVLPTTSTLDGGFGGFESSASFGTAATLTTDDDAWGPPSVVDVDDNWGAAWDSAADREADEDGTCDDVKPDEWEAARREKERMNRAVPPEFLSSLLQKCEEVTSELWPTDKEQSAESQLDNWRMKGPEGIDRFSKILDKVLPPERPTLETFRPFAQTGIHKEMTTALRLSRHTPVAMRSPLTRYLDARGTQRWHGTTTIMEEDATPAGWRILEKKPEEEVKHSAAPKKTGWLSYWNRRNPSTTSVDNPKSQTSPRSSMDNTRVKSPQILETTHSTDKATSPTAASPVSINMPPEQPASTSTSNMPNPPSIDVFPPAVPGPSAVSRFLKRFSSRQSRPGSALALSSDDLEFLDDVPYHGDDDKDDDDWSAMFNKPVVQPAAPTPLPPKLAPPPPPSAPAHPSPVSRQASILSLPPPLAPSLSSRSSTPVPISPSSSSTPQPGSRAQSPFQLPPPPSNSIFPPPKVAPLIPPPQPTPSTATSPVTPKPFATQASTFEDFMDFTDASKRPNGTGASEAGPSRASRAVQLHADEDDFSDFFDAHAAIPPRPSTPVRSSNSLDNFRSPSTVASSSSFQSSSSSKPLTRAIAPSRSRLSSLTGFDSPDQVPTTRPKERGWEFDEEREELAAGGGDDFNDFVSSPIHTPSPPPLPTKTHPAIAHPTSPTRTSTRSFVPAALVGPPRVPTQKPASSSLGMIPPPTTASKAIPPVASRTPTLPPPPLSRTPTLPPPPGSKPGLIPPPPGMLPVRANFAAQRPDFDLLGDAFPAAPVQAIAGVVRDATLPVASLSPSPSPMNTGGLAPSLMSFAPSAPPKPAPSQLFTSTSSHSKGGGLSAQDLSFFEGL